MLCGGTGLYINALTKGMRLSERADEALRAGAEAIAAEDGGEERLHGCWLRSTRNRPRGIRRATCGA